MIDLERARAFLASSHQGILATLKRDGRPQLSNVLYALDDEGRLLISVTQDRAKTHNLRRDPRASLHVAGSSFWEYVVVEGTCRFIEGEGVLEALRDYYRRVRGEHPDWDEYDRAMVADRRLQGEHSDWEEYDRAMVAERRLLLSLSLERAYGVLGAR